MLIAGLMFAAALAAPVSGEPATSPAPNTVTAAAKPAEPKKVCVTETQMGSLMKKRICATPDEWERRRQADANEMSKMRDRAAACSGAAC